MDVIDWKKNHILFISEKKDLLDKLCEAEGMKLRKTIEPWLTAVFQSEHLSLLLGTGITTGICNNAGITSKTMQRIVFKINNPKQPDKYKVIISKYADNQLLFFPEARRILKMI
jgi:hypothetical protein